MRQAAAEAARKLSRRIELRIAKSQLQHLSRRTTDLRRSIKKANDQ
jgi:hypothetical protein